MNVKYGAKRAYRKPVYKRVRKGRTNLKRTISMVIKKSLSSKIEKKQWVYYQNYNAVSTCSASIPVNVNLLPTSMIQGIGDAQRVGNQIKISQATIEGYVSLAPYNSITNPLSTPVMVKMFMFKSKQVNTQNLGATSISTNFFKVNNSGTGFQGNTLDLVLPIDIDMFTLLSTKTFKLGAASATTTGKVGTSGYYDNSPMNHHFKFNYGRHVKSQLKFDDNNSITNNNLWLAVQVVYADGSTLAIQPALWCYCVNIHYTDL